MKMAQTKLKVINIGTEWFVPFLEEQGVNVLRVEWSPPVERPSDITSILRKLRK